jgi:hypothetical protein
MQIIKRELRRSRSDPGTSRSQALTDQGATRSQALTDQGATRSQALTDQGAASLLPPNQQRPIPARSTLTEPPLPPRHRSLSRRTAGESPWANWR